MTTEIKKKQKLTPPTICSICFRPIPAQGTWLLGNNAQPVNAGRCCDYCNSVVVVPARLERMGMSKEAAKALGEDLRRSGVK